MDNTKVFESPDFLENLLRHLAMCPQVMEKAMSYRLSADDFVVDDVMGIKIYREFARIILLMGVAPINPGLFITYIKQAVDNDLIPADQTQHVANLYNFIFNDKSVLAGEFICENLTNFIRYRRILKAKIKHREDIDQLVVEYSTISREIAMLEASKVVRSFSPFESLVIRPDRNHIIPTGFPPIDAVIGGYGKAELMYLFGFNGGGKTATMSFMARAAAMMGHKALIIELEEPGENISNRLYSPVFKIPYTDLHHKRPGIEEQLVEAFNTLDPVTRRLLLNVQIDDLCGTQSTCNSLESWIEERATRTGFIPDVIFIDQKTFIHPNDKMSGERGDWEVEKRVSNDLKGLSEHKIQGQWNYALWCLSQVKGDPKLKFTRRDLAGYKEITQPAALGMGVGKDPVEANRMLSLFSVKTRHVSPFAFEFHHNLNYMDIDPAGTIQSTTLGGPQSPQSNPSSGRQPNPPSAAPPARPPELVQLGL